MQKILTALAPAALFAAGFAAASADAATPIAGRWMTEEKTAIVTVGPCGSNVCGRLTTLLKQPPSGPPVDSNNPDPALRRRPLEGLVILSGFADKGDDWRGKIYDPKSGKTYKSILKRESDGTLKVQGCIAFFCRTQRWTPVKG
ncbi:DUF2147 domain-containing protein [Microvirga sp. SRT01]|jgi:uncharacterized protein (DUF2147 family)|uniref:DUF2147 domain-containing protein n=1 Tax=Sphingomonas longa TaxID=2778730 RepID=A0ABS2DBG2_9SPHN|nr:MULTISPECIES: DUF2147 domain-containing protein [Alphaproteobacteria]MBM6577349.1 DUF2147 domain-containing protein [Sphingomonas sp. BT552]MBR7710394.1 DUF2147 domain-containing protein [Microvirga sp. SRT01]